MKKPALTIARDDLPYAEAGECRAYPIPANLFLLPTKLVDRVGEESCEENPRRQQLIPYLVLISESDEFFVYSRGAAGAEDKLRSQLSVGLGGHVDSAPSLGQSLHSLVVEEARRELAEEVGLTGKVEIIFDALLLDRTKETEGGKVYVGQVHAGLLSFVRCSTRQITKLEEGIIENGRWLTLKEIRKPENFSRLEKWSQSAVEEYLRRNP